MANAVKKWKIEVLDWMQSNKSWKTNNGLLSIVKVPLRSIGDKNRTSHGRSNNHVIQLTNTERYTIVQTIHVSVRSVTVIPIVSVANSLDKFLSWALVKWLTGVLNSTIHYSLITKDLNSHLLQFSLSSKDQWTILNDPSNLALKKLARVVVDIKQENSCQWKWRQKYRADMSNECGTWQQRLEAFTNLSLQSHKSPKPR